MRSCLQSFLLKTDTAASVSGAGGVEQEEGGGEEEEDKENLKVDIFRKSRTLLEFGVFKVCVGNTWV